MKVEVNIDLDNLNKTVVSYKSPQAFDIEMNPISMVFGGLNKYPFFAVNINLD